MMMPFAIYRLPFSNVYTKVTSISDTPVVLRSVSEIGCRRGFVVAPFAADEDCPIVVIEGKEEVHSIPADFEDTYTERQHFSNCPAKDITSDVNGYSTVFQQFHSQLTEGRFRKIVLARQTAVGTHRFEEEKDFVSHAERLFFRACGLYLRLFVALVSTPQTGTWLVATPEILLEGNNGNWRTMALAGTMKLTPDQMSFDTPPTGKRIHSDSIRWSDKNISEQRHVATYINNCLSHFTTDITEDGPYTSRAGDLVHLRSDFSFHLKNDINIGALLNALHPTPAVCGLPKEETYRFIIDNEPAPRRYYSGFMGPLDTDGDTHLYVSLRCMELQEGQYRLHAGGGLLKDSRMEQEWEETEAKMQTMRTVISQDNV